MVAFLAGVYGTPVPTAGDKVSSFFFYLFSQIINLIIYICINKIDKYKK
jgi:hypothetical protein